MKVVWARDYYISFSVYHSFFSLYREATQKLQSRGVVVNYNTDRPKNLPQELVDLPVEPLFDRI